MSQNELADATPTRESSAKETFASLLRRHRLAAVLTQERLAERAGLSSAGIATLEAGRRRAPRANTVLLLLNALGLEGDARSEMITAALDSTGGNPAVGERSTSPPNLRVTSSSSTKTSALGTPIGNFARPQNQGRFFGRPQELRRLKKVVSSARVVLISGEAGVGKTRLVEELASSLTNTCAVLWGRCTPDRLGVYEPFTAPIRALLAQSPDTTNTAKRVGELARLVPGLVNERGWIDTTRSADPDVERRLLFEAVSDLLAQLGPTIFVLDDIQWADAGSLSLLAHLTNDSHLSDLTMIATVRSTDQDATNAAALSDLRRNGRVERVVLTGLERSEVEALVHDLAGDQCSDALVDAVILATEGNPLFIEELTEHLIAHGFGISNLVGLPGHRATEVSVPTGVRDTIGHRVATLSTDARSLLRAGAVLGRSFDPDLAALLGGLATNRYLTATEDALLSGLVTEQSARELSFSHGLVQSAVYEATSARRRLELHRHAATELESQVAAGASANESLTFAIARHWHVVASSDSTAAASAAAWARLAGDAAAAGADIDEAILRYESAATLWVGPTAEHIVTLLRLGSALSARGRIKEADDRFRTAMALSEAQGDSVLLAKAAIGLAATVQYGFADPERIEALERALTFLPNDEYVMRTLLAAMLKRQLGFDLSEDAYRRRQIAAHIVLDAVTADNLPEELLLTLGTARDAIMVDDPVMLDRLSRQIITAGNAARNLNALAHGWYGRAWASLELADGPGWTESTRSFTEVANDLGLPYEQALAHTMAANSALIEGRYDDAQVAADRALALGSGIDPNASTIHLTNAVMRGIDLGQASEMVELMRVSRDDLDKVPTFLAGFAMTASVGGAHELAHELLAEFAIDFDTVRRDLEWLPVMGFLCHTATVLEAKVHAEALYSRLASHPARAVRVGPLAGWWGTTDHHLGALCRVLGNLGEAESRLRRSIDTCLAIGARPWHARGQLELARIIELQAGHAVPEASRLRTQATVTVTQLGAVGIATS